MPAWLLFKELVYDAFKAPVRDTILGLVQRERDGEPQDRMLLKNAVQVCACVCVRCGVVMCFGRP